MYKKVKIFLEIGILIWTILQVGSCETSPSSSKTDGDHKANAGQYLGQAKPAMLYGIETEGMRIIKRRVKQDQRFIDLLKGSYVSTTVLQQINLLPDTIFDFRKIVVKKKYTLLVYSDSLSTARAMIYEPNPVDYIIFHLEDTLIIESGQREIITTQKGIVGQIESSLAETIDDLDIPKQITNRIVDIFAWQIDFQRLQKGDLFKLVYQEQRVEGKIIGIGKIDGIYFDHAGTGYCAFAFDQDEKFEYFDEQGNSLQKSLLKYPIEFTRISSRYQRVRFHPVTKTYRPHLSTDFAAPMRTPIRSVGDGVVLQARYKVYNGNYVKIRHNDVYTTQYLHMSKIAQGIKKGAKVVKGQKIGYVGKTGLVTGPHLCYQFWKNGVQVDVLKEELPSSQSIQEENRSAFLNVKKKVTDQFDSIPFPAANNKMSLNYLLF